MEQAKAFLEESLDLNALLGDLGSVDLSRSTGFKAWSIETILRHLHFWNQMALWALEDTPQLQETLVLCIDVTLEPLDQNHKLFLVYLLLILRHCTELSMQLLDLILVQNNRSVDRFSLLYYLLALQVER